MSDTRIGKYARLEVERRYLLRALPADLATRPPDRRITDHYLPDARFRRVEYADGSPPTYKLGQKFRAPAQSPLETTITNMTLTPAEYHLLRALGGRELTKGRTLYRPSGLLYGVDVFHGPLAGLILAEAEFPSPALAAPAPAFAAAEVTNDPSFTGGHLVTRSATELRDILAPYLGNVA